LSKAAGGEDRRAFLRQGERHSQNGNGCRETPPPIRLNDLDIEFHSGYGSGTAYAREKSLPFAISAISGSTSP
jgi:hypothetical protein